VGAKLAKARKKVEIIKSVILANPISSTMKEIEKI
jgi:hypothetical protein